MVYYRKYRPQAISDLDSASLRKTLYAILNGKNIPHAFLFTGPKGLGKTSTARIVAKIINCEQVKNGEPDNTCSQCTSITSGTNIDILEIDGASNRGIDEIRELRERVTLAPSNAKRKVYIIDEVHMLTTEAFNALLKTIEEPPEHVIFIFCTTEPQKVPATILSRCCHITFQLATESEIVHSLKRVVVGENLHVADDVLQIIATMAEGGFRDAAKIFEEIVSLAGENPITKDFVEEHYHLKSIRILAGQLVEQLFRRDTRKAITVVNQAVEAGINMQYLLEELLEVLHTLLLTKAGITTEKPVQYSFAFSNVEISELVSLFSEAHAQIKHSVIAQLPLEMGIIVWCNRHDDTASDRAEPLPIKSQQKATMDTLLKKQQEIKLRNMLSGKKADEKTQSKHVAPIEQSDISYSADSLTTLYENIIYKVKPQNHSIAGILRGSKIIKVTEEAIFFEAAYKFHKERLEEQRTCEIIEQAIKEITGKPLKVSVVIKK